MPPEFTGNPAPLTREDFARAADALGCSAAAVRAVVEVESKGGFLPDARPRILFERHKFSAFTHGRWDADHLAISNPTPGGYLGGAREYDRLGQAIALDREAALKSASWGAFQLMGFNHALAGYPDVVSFVAAMVSGHAAQLDAFVTFAKASGLAAALAAQDWPAFARGYNGPAYTRFAYDEKIAAACARFAAEPLPLAPQRSHLPAEEAPLPTTPLSAWEGPLPITPLPVGEGPGEGAPPHPQAHPILAPGASGGAVRQLQRLLGLKQDGIFGPATRIAVLARQRAAGLTADGIVGPRTWAALGE